MPRLHFGSTRARARAGVFFWRREARHSWIIFRLKKAPEFPGCFARLFWPKTSGDFYGGFLAKKSRGFSPGFFGPKTPRQSRLKMAQKTPREFWAKKPPENSPGILGQKNPAKIPGKFWPKKPRKNPRTFLAKKTPQKSPDVFGQKKPRKNPEERLVEKRRRKPMTRSPGQQTTQKRSFCSVSTGGDRGRRRRFAGAPIGSERPGGRVRRAARQTTDQQTPLRYGAPQGRRGTRRGRWARRRRTDNGPLFLHAPPERTRRRCLFVNANRGHSFPCFAQPS